MPAEVDPATAAATSAKAIAEAERDAAKARLEKAKAEAELAVLEELQSAKNAESVAAAQKAQFDKDKAAADARTAAIAAEQAAIKAEFGGIATNATALPAVEAGAGAGTAEANLLAARALDALAGRIAANLATEDAGTKFLIVAGTARPQFATTLLYKFRRPLVEKLFTDANSGSAKIEQDYAKFKAQNASLAAAGGTESFAALTAAGAALDAASRIASYFQTSYKFDNLTLSGITDQTLAVAVAGKLAAKPGVSAYFTDRVYDNDMAEAVYGELKALIDTSIKSNGNQAKAEAALRELDVMLKAAKTDQKKREIEALVAGFTRSLAAEKAASKAFEDFVTLLGTADNGKTMIQRVAEERKLAELMQTGAKVLYLNVSAQGGTSYTRKSIWNFLGKQPMYVSGSVVANWALVDPNGLVRKSGVETGHSGYKSVGNIPGY